MAKSCSLAGYVQLRTDRFDAPLGGTAIYYKRSLQCCPIDLPNNTNIEATGCRLAMTGHKPLVIVSIYLSPSKVARSDIEALSLRGCRYPLRRLQFKHTNWGCIVSNPGDDLVSRPSTIDLAITKEVALNVGCIEPIHRLDHRLFSKARTAATTDEIDSSIITNHQDGGQRCSWGSGVYRPENCGRS
ncbi:hypothetical protein EVAR_36222_1 [Eumeta japonica]|uniref:Uncharacterized protein n=1 Tax=Eumeta variegata TaxID=151549 RepID=A0A4C1VUD9_EUMVA|nr:hypothetical protein EVAR_36222_1 [Eumeta japonica]